MRFDAYLVNGFVIRPPGSFTLMDLQVAYLGLFSSLIDSAAFYYQFALVRVFPENRIRV